MDKQKSVVQLHYKDCLTDSKSEIQTRIESGYFQEIWISYQRRKTSDVTPQRIRKFLTVMSNWIDSAVKNNTDVFVVGVTGSHWDVTPFSQLVTDKVLKQSVHRLCYFDYKMDERQEKPSRVCIKVLSTKALRNHNCKCGIPYEEHYNDWKVGSSEDNRRPKNRAISLVCGNVLKELCSSGGRLPEPDGMFQTTTSTASTSSGKDKRVKFKEPDTNNRSETSVEHCAYPTDQRQEWKRKQKENKEAGLEVRKKKKVVEEHFDDCGTDISGLGPVSDTDYAVTELANMDEDKEEHFVSLLTQALEQNWFKGSEWDEISNTYKTFPNAQQIPNVYLLMTYLESVSIGVDIVELCGGEGRVSIIAIKRKCKVGPNFDLVTSWDLNDPAQQKEVERYFDLYKPFIAIMGPMCKPFGKLSNYNYIYNHEAWLRSYEEALPHGKFCAEIALKQMSGGRFFLVEQPSGSWLFAEYPWPQVINNENIVSIEIHQCVLGQKTKEGFPAKKPTTLVANHPVLLEPFRNSRCHGRHVHGHLIGGRAAAAQVWPWKMAEKIVQGVINLKRYLRHNAYPTIGTGPQDPDEEGKDPKLMKCVACQHRRRIGDTRHTRIQGECLRWQDQPIAYNIEKIQSLLKFSIAAQI